VGAPLSGSLPSTWNSRWPRGRCTAPGRAPCSYSSGSRTSRKVTPPPSSRACASAWSTSRMDFLASFSRSRGVGTLEPPGHTAPFLRPVTEGKTLPAGSTFPMGHAGPRPRIVPAQRSGGRLRSVEFEDAVLRRHMVRSFATTPVDRAVVDRIGRQGLRSPTAGNTGGTAWIVLEGPEQTARYFDATTDAAWRSDHPRWHAGLRRAPVVLLAYASSALYVDRYAEPDKAGAAGDAALGQGPEHWPVPYWTG